MRPAPTGSGRKQVVEVDSDEDEKSPPKPKPVVSDFQHMMAKAAKLPKKKKRDKPSDPAPPSAPPSPEAERGPSLVSAADDDDDEGDDGVLGDQQPMSEGSSDKEEEEAAPAPAAAAVVAAPSGSPEELEQQKAAIEAALVTVEQLLQAEQEASAAKMNVATNDNKLKTAKAEDRAMAGIGDEGIAQAAAQNAHKMAKSDLAAARKRQKTDKASVTPQEIRDLEAAEELAQTGRTQAEKEFNAAKAAVATRIKELVEKANALANTAKEKANALAELRQKKATDEQALKDLDRAIKSAASDEKKVVAAEKKEAKAAEKEAAAAEKAAEKAAQEKQKQCASLACQIHDFRDRILLDLRLEASEMKRELEKNDWCEGAEDEYYMIPEADALWFKELVRFVNGVEVRLKRMIRDNVGVRGQPVDWREARHKHMMDPDNEICGDEEDRDRLGNTEMSDDEEASGSDADFVVDDEDDDESDSDNSADWESSRKKAAAAHVKSGENKAQMAAKFAPHFQKDADPKAQVKDKDATKKALKAAQSEEPEAPLEMPPKRETKPIDITSKAEGKQKKRVTPSRVVKEDDSDDEE
jgi:hypothetical protein